MSNNHNFKNILLISTIAASSAFCQTATASISDEIAEKTLKMKKTRIAPITPKKKIYNSVHKSLRMNSLLLKAKQLNSNITESKIDEDMHEWEDKSEPRKHHDIAPSVIPTAVTPPSRKLKKREPKVQEEATASSKLKNNISLSFLRDAMLKRRKSIKGDSSADKVVRTDSADKVVMVAPHDRIEVATESTKTKLKTKSEKRRLKKKEKRRLKRREERKIKRETKEQENKKALSQKKTILNAKKKTNNTSNERAEKLKALEENKKALSQETTILTAKKKNNNESIRRAEKTKATERKIKATKQYAKQTTQATQSVITDLQSNIGEVISDRIFNTMPMVGLAAGDENSFNEKGVWINGFIAKGNKKGENSYKSNSQGGTIGFDAKVADNITLGLAYSKLFSKIKPSDKDIDSFSISFDALSLYNQIEMGKFISESILSANKSKGKSKSKGFSAETSLNYAGKLNDNLVLMPFASIGYMSNNSKSYKENTANISSSSSALFNKKLGIKILSTMKISELVKIAPSLKASISHSTNVKGKNKRTIHIHFQDKSYGQIINKNSSGVNYNLGAGVLMQRNNINLQATYNCSLKSKYSSHQGALKLRVNL